MVFDTDERPSSPSGMKPAHAIVDGAKLIWPCSLCGEPIADRSGHLIVSVHAADERHGQAEAVRAAARTPIQLPTGQTAAMYSLAELDQMPAEVPWYAVHKTCDPDPESPDYAISIERIHSLVSLVHWTAHLNEKTWLGDTTWIGILRNIGDQGGDL